VTVSIPMLLIFFTELNHAHGLTTFGKSPNSNTQSTTRAPTKSCKTHSDCIFTNGLSCVKDPFDSTRHACLCGDNRPPISGKCSSNYRGPGHLCENHAICVHNSQCVLMDKRGSPTSEKVCKCMEGFIAHNNMCNGGVPTSSLSGLIVLLVISWTMFF